MKVRWHVAICILMAVMMNGFTSGIVYGDFRIAIMQDEKGAAEKYRPLVKYLEEKDIDISFVAARSYPHAAEMFESGLADGMFSGSGIAGCMIIKELAYPVVRPVSVDGWSTYWAVVIGPKNSKRFTQNTDYFDNKRVIFCSLASAGEFYFHSLEGGVPAYVTILKASSHGAALDALARQAADFAIVKNRVWDKAEQNYPGLMRVGEDPGENPDGTLIVSVKTEKAIAMKLRDALLALKDDPSASALTVKKELKITEFITTTVEDFKSTLQLLKKAGVTREFNFDF
ncbi:MAG: phosphate/phosphite/phosphonate ABC transporter substrate-binding protein [Proteobacteria bacterium]|nr:phosphate/phosphite/phosphonate ABC transporter substrate-binding protein [Desulfobacula sp.]MBU3954134.1 phosphate/phosphite/phosphonate ABC transporter substrate-binding protein [Pseudomonadota bacterium]